MIGCIMRPDRLCGNIVVLVDRDACRHLVLVEVIYVNTIEVLNECMVKKSLLINCDDRLI